MSVQAISWVIGHPTITDRTEFCVMFALANRADPEGWCWPSEERLARESRCSRRTVQRVMLDLISKGWIERHSRPGTSSMYRLTMPASPAPELLDDDSLAVEVRHGDAPSRPVDNRPRVRHGGAPSGREVRHDDAPGASSGGAPGASSGDARTVKNRQETSAPLGVCVVDDPGLAFDLIAGRYMPAEMQAEGTRRLDELRLRLERRKQGVSVDESDER